MVDLRNNQSFMIANTGSSLNISSCQWLVGKEHIEDIIAPCKSQFYLYKSMVCQKKKYIYIVEHVATKLTYVVTYT